MKIILLSFFLVNIFDLYSQDIDWRQGSLVLNTSDKRVIAGNLAIDPSKAVILVQSLPGADVYPLEKISRVYYYDVKANINRRYLVLPLVRPQLYEVVVDGTIKVLRIQKQFSKGVHHRDDFHYYVWFNNNLVQLRQFRDKIYPELRQQMLYEATLKDRIRTDGDVVRLVKHLNEVNRKSSGPLLALAND